MADKKIESQTLEREYTIPLRNEWRKVANYRRAGRAVKEIKTFIARHMKVPNRDLSKVKLDIYLNNEVWFRGRRKPPARIKVLAKKEGDLVKVELAEVPVHVKFLKKKHEKLNRPAEKPKSPTQPIEKKEEKSKEEKKEEKEKAKSVAEQHAKQAKQEAKAQQKATSVKEPGYHRQALKK